MDTKDLHVFAAVYEAKNISRAAKDLYLSPQGCSKIIHKIEHELDTVLFSRCHHGVRATPQGDALFRQAEQLIQILDGIKASIDGARAMKQTLNIASTQGTSAYLSMMFVRDFRERHQHISPRIIESPDAAAKARILGNEAELGVLGGPIDLAVYCAIPFTKHRPCVVINEKNPLARKKCISFFDLDCQPLAMVSREFASHHLVVNRLINAGAQVDIVMEATELDYCHKLAEENEALAISFDFAAWSNRRTGTVIRPFEDSTFMWETYIVYKREVTLSAAAQNFCDFASDWLTQNKEKLFRWPANGESV